MKKIIRHDSSASTQKIWRLVDKAAERAPQKVLDRINNTTTPKDPKSGAKVSGR